MQWCPICSLTEARHAAFDTWGSRLTNGPTDDLVRSVSSAVQDWCDAYGLGQESYDHIMLELEPILRRGARIASPTRCY